ncbi:MAG: PAS domain S-box protein [Proteobacteria bacterium]|nr:PAS domain S-box protein [Pseudomonadota bacterium]
MRNGKEASTAVTSGHPTRTDDDRSSRAERLLASIQNVVWEADLDLGNFIYVSPQAEHLLGYPRTAWLAPNFWADHIHPDDRTRTVEFCQRAVSERRSHYFEYRMIALDGREVWIGDSVTVVVEEGQARRLCGVMSEVPARLFGRANMQSPTTPAPATLSPAAHAADIERQQRLHFLECMERVNTVVQRGAGDLQQVMSELLDVLLEIFDCDRARLLARRELEPTRWMQRLVRQRDGTPSIAEPRIADELVEDMLRKVMAAPGALRFGPQAALAIAPSVRASQQLQSLLAVRIDPNIGGPCILELHQSRFARVWSASEVRLFEQLALRIADALGALVAHHALKLSESRLADAQRLARIGYWERDLDAGLVTLSEQTCHILGVPPFDGPQNLDECNARWLSHVHPDDRERVAQAMNDTIHLGTPYDVEYRLINLDGETLHLRSIGRDIPRGPGQARRWFGTLQDNTPLRRMEEELRRSEARFQAYMNHTTDSITVHDEVGRVVEVNQQLCDSLGYSREDFLGQFPYFYDPSITALHLFSIGRRLDAGEVVAFRTRHRRKDGSEIPTEVRIRRFKIEGQTRGVAVTRDISEQVKAERALQENHALLQAIVEGSADAISVKDKDGRYLLINAAGAWRLGHPAEEIIGHTDAELAPDKQATVTSRRALPAPQLLNGEMFEEVVTLGSATRHYLSTSHGFRDAAHHDVGVVSISRDITELRRLEDQLRHAQKMDAIGRLAGGVAHDFNNLLTVILGYGTVVHGRLAADDVNLRPLEEMLKCGERAANLIRQLLAFSRKQTLHPARVRLQELLGEWRQLIRPLLSEDVELEISVDAEVGAVEVDPVYLEQALTNLAINARDAMPDGGRLGIELSAVHLDVDACARLGLATPGPYALVRVSDTGIGMDAETQARIFEPFFTTKAVDKGTGLGLAMVYGFVAQSAGHLEVSSSPGQGSVFSLLLPCATQAPSWEIPSTTLPAPAPRQGDETVLLVEDEAAVRKLTRELLEHQGYRVIEAADGVEALDLAARHAGVIDLLLTDVVMPRMKGPELAAKLAAARPGVRVLFMSGHSERGGTPLPEVMIKPFRPETLAKRVRDELDKHAP